MYESFAETRFQIGIPKSSGGYKFRTTVVRAGSGVEKRVEHNLQPSFPGLENQPMYEGELGNLVVTQCELDYMTNFFNARRGKNQGFRFKNWADYKCSHLPDYGHKGEINATYTQGVTYPAVGDGTNKKFKMVKVYFSQEEVTYKALHKIVSNTAQVYVNNTLDEMAFVDINNGEIHFETAPPVGSVITHNCEFDLPVRFDTDEMIGASEFHDPKTGRLCYTYGGLPVTEFLPSLPVSNPVFQTPLPFYGGQCLCVVYIVYAEMFAPSENRWDGLNITNWYGKILGIKVEIHPTNGDTVYLLCHGSESGNVCQVEPTWVPMYQTGGAKGLYTKARITGVTRRDGLPDNCGNPPPLVITPEPPFYGGQCANIRYNVYARIVANGISDPVASFEVFGAVGGARAKIIEEAPNYYRAVYEIYCSGGSNVITPAPSPAGWYTVGQTPNMPQNTTFEIVSIERTDGQPDTCGNPPPLT